MLEDTPGELEFNAKRLRRVVNLLGLGNAVPESDRELLDCMGSVLAMVARKIEELKADHALLLAAQPQEAVGRVIREGSDSMFKISWLKPPGPDGTMLYAGPAQAVPAEYMLVRKEPITGERYRNGEWSRRNWEAALQDQATAPVAATAVPDALPLLKRVAAHLTRYNGSSGYRDGEQKLLEDVRAMLAAPSAKAHEKKGSET